MQQCREKDRASHAFASPLTVFIGRAVLQQDSVCHHHCHSRTLNQQELTLKTMHKHKYVQAITHTVGRATFSYTKTNIQAFTQTVEKV